MLNLSAGAISATNTDVATMHIPDPKPSMKRPMHKLGIVNHICGTTLTIIIKLARVIVFMRPIGNILSEQSAPSISPIIAQLVVIVT